MSKHIVYDLSWTNVPNSTGELEQVRVSIELDTEKLGSLIRKANRSQNRKSSICGGTIILRTERTGTPIQLVKGK